MSYKKAYELLAKARNACVLTGAGISTESGIKDFRSSDGYYKNFDPVTALSKEVLLNDPQRFYNEGYKILEDLEGKKPNKAHYILKEMQDLGLINQIITQNIDNLHTMAGSKEVYEVHGQTRTVRCTRCSTQYDFSYMREQVARKIIPPKCEKCGSVLRPNVVMFGDMMPYDFEIALEIARKSDVIMVIGSSLTVSPVNFLTEYAKHLIIINKEKTPQDQRADVVLQERASEALEKILQEAKNYDV